MQTSTRAVLGFLALASILLTGCGDATTGNGPGDPDGDGGGGAFESTAGPNGGVIGGLNSVMTITFTQALDAASVNASAIQVVTVDDATGLSTVPGGVVASVFFDVTGSKLEIRPTVTLSSSNVEYGLVANALYEVSFASPGSGNVLLATNGDELQNSDATFFFRTPAKGGDGKPGFPSVRAFFVDDLDGLALPDTIPDTDGDGDAVNEAVALLPGAEEIILQTPAQVVPVAPVSEIAFVFDEAVIPDTVVNPLDGSSPSIAVLFNTVPLPGFAPQVTPASVTFVKQQQNVTIVRWKPAVQAYPPSGFLFVEVSGLVEDLACNSKFSVSGSGDPGLFIGVLVGEPIDNEFEPIVEPFTNDAKEDAVATSADWAGGFAGELGPVFSGGSGIDGDFVLDPAGTLAAPGDTVVPSDAMIDYTDRLVALPVVRQVSAGVFEPRSWNFTRITIPPTWTVKVLTDRDGDGTPDPDEFVVQSAGHPLDGRGAPLVLRSSGNFRLGGTIDVSGVSAVDGERPFSEVSGGYDDYLGQGAPGAEPLLAAGAGGRGGDALLLREDGTVALPLVAPAGGFQPADADGLFRGVTGRSSGLTATTLTDTTTDLSALIAPSGSNPTGDATLAAAVANGEIMLQPNVGIGSQQLFNAGTNNIEIDENHPTFVVASVESAGGVNTITVVDNADGGMTQISENVGNDFSPIAAGGDSYMIGRFAGSQGADASPLDRGGEGAMPYAVVNATAITTTGGGGGGGGGRFPGSKGGSSGPESLPFIDQRGSSGGLSLNDADGAEGGVGAIAGSVQVVSDTELDLVEQTSGIDLADLTGATLEGALLIPNSDFDGWMFRVASFNGTTFVIEPIVTDALEVRLTDGPGASGPGLGLGVVVDFLVIPSLDVGGAGGGGAGVSITGSLNVAASNLSVLTPGAGAGAGGGSVILETAGTFSLEPTARVLARGGDGATYTDGAGTFFAGGGGGGGGNIVVRAGKELSITDGAILSAEGGEGGGVDGFGRGGAGGGGFIRFENSTDSLSAVLLSSFTTPAIGEANVGRALGAAQGVGRSRFYDTMLANASFERFEVDYRADTNDDGVLEDFQWAFGQTGVEATPANVIDPPFLFTVNSVPANDQGILNTNLVNEFFVPPADLVSARTGLVWDEVDDVLLYIPGGGALEIVRLNPDLTPAAPATIPLPFIVAEGTNTFDIASMAVNAVEIYLLEAKTGRVIVLDRTGTFRRSVMLPKVIAGAMVVDASGNLVIVNNEAGTLDVYESLDTGAADPPTTDVELTSSLSAEPILRDGVAVGRLNVTGMALAPSGTELWCADSATSEIFVLSLAAGGIASSMTGVDPSGLLELPGGDGIIPSGLAFDGVTLSFVHAVEKTDTTITQLVPVDVGLIGGPVVIPAFGGPAPAGAEAFGDGDQFLRFEIAFVPADEASGFNLVRIDEVRVFFANESF